MKEAILFIGLLISIIRCSCSFHEKTDNNLYHIDIEANMHKMQQINLSKFTKSIEYLPMEIKDNLAFTGIWECVFSDKYFLAKDISKCLLYDYNGKLISIIGNRGRGPGEYQYVNNVAFGLNKIYLQSLRDLMEYGFDGSFHDIHRNLFFFKSYYVGKWLPLNDSLFFGKIETIVGNEPCKALIFDLNGNTVKEFKNYIIFQREKPLSSETERHANIYRFQNEIFFKELHNDTLFYLSEQLELIPKYVIDLGQYTVPVSIRKLLIIPENNYMTVNNVFQTSDYLFLDTNFGSHFPARRLTPIKLPIFNIESYYNTQDVLGIFDRRNKELIFCSPTSTDNPLFTTGFYNDVDAGPRFFPMKQVNDSTMVMWVDSKQLKDHIASEEFKNAKPLYPEKKEELKHLADSLSEYDNPVLMFVTFKSEK
ncbi:MAG TPA: 6-bladed beta-propeller [Bacteroidales bacterium]|nr:6-bladed beta-propeller [Bacteroidales bacterium]HQJ21616.1 6-bladed beta-propeller [Bacteroidales bacterium]